jgi:CheY-like chemotaxis protein
MEALGQLAGGIAHDFNNMLTVIESYSAMLLTDRALEAGARADIAEILTAARRAASLTRQLLAFSRQQVLQPRVLSINDAIDDVERMLRRLIDGHIEFRTKLSPNLHMVMADPTQIEQVLVNLVVNARDAMAGGGTITIETGNVVLDASFAQRAPAPRPGPYVMLAVSDTGTGIPAEVLDRIFEPFYTTKDVGRGTGLGLATVQGIVEQSGGHVSVYSEPKQGTTFRVYLPRAEKSETVSTPAAPAVTTPFGHETILLVEDDAAVRSVTGSVLRRAGHSVIEASNGVDAVAIAERNYPEITLVISDIVMPGMDGRELTTELSRRRPNLPILLMSGYTRDTLSGNSELAASGAFIEKPFTPEKLMKKVSDVLEAAHAASASLRE